MVKQKDIKFTFGKYKDILIADVPNHYLNWLMEQDWFISKFVELQEQVEIELKYREQHNIIIE
jgi:uncharacterized protein (DUF3820 family)